jgi:NAD(P)-dependent dehydrogenase (short-subunit alcohol dehydrogenase family)
VTADLVGRVALVTGGGTGIGAGISAALADAGAQVAIGQSGDDKAQLAAQALAFGARDVIGIGADLSTADGCRHLVSECLRLRGRIDILVNNAAVTGAPAVGPFLEFSDDRLDNLVDVNLKAAFRCARDAARDMVLRGHGVIVNISSVGAYAAQQHATAYVATKAGLVGLTKGVGFELAPLGIRVVGVAPGDIDLDPATTADTADPAATNWWERRTPLGRRGRPSDIGAVVAFLCSDEAAFITAETVVVDGGWLSY